MPTGARVIVLIIRHLGAKSVGDGEPSIKKLYSRGVIFTGALARVRDSVSSILVLEGLEKN
jgi:hypothetical protein